MVCGSSSFATWWFLIIQWDTIDMLTILPERSVLLTLKPYSTEDLLYDKVKTSLHTNASSILIHIHS